MNPVSTSRIIVGNRIRRDLPNVPRLAKSIEARGQLHPIVVRASDWHLLAGARRLAACKHLGRDVLVRLVATAEDALEALQCEGDEQLECEPWNAEERVRYAQQLLALEEAAAADRRSAGAAKGGKAKAAAACGSADPQAEQEAKGEGGRAKARAAAAAGFKSRRAFERAAEIVEAVEAQPELAPLLEKLNETGKTEAVHRELQRAQALGGVIHDKDSYCTPKWILDGVHACEPGGIALDSCTNAIAIELGHVRARFNWTIDDNALEQPTWGVEGGETVLWYQPPYGDPAALTERLAKEWDAGNLRRAYCLVKNDPSTEWWGLLRERACALVVPRKRLAHEIAAGVVVGGSDFNSAMHVLARGTAVELLDLCTRLVEAYEGEADVYVAPWVLKLAAVEKAVSAHRAKRAAQVNGELGWPCVGCGNSTRHLILERIKDGEIEIRRVQCTECGALQRLTWPLPTVVLVACSGDKAKAAAPARELYQGSLYKLRVAWAEAYHGGIAGILSAEHGLVDPDQVLEPYDTKMGDMSKAQRGIWAGRVGAQVRNRFPAGTRVIVLAGKDYLGWTAAGRTVEHYSHKGIGYERADLTKALRAKGVEP